MYGFVRRLSMGGGRLPPENTGRLTQSRAPSRPRDSLAEPTPVRHGRFVVAVMRSSEGHAQAVRGPRSLYTLLLASRPEYVGEGEGYDNFRHPISREGRVDPEGRHRAGTKEALEPGANSGDGSVRGDDLFYLVGRRGHLPERLLQRSTDARCIGFSDGVRGQPRGAARRPERASPPAVAHLERLDDPVRGERPQPERLRPRR